MLVARVSDEKECFLSYSVKAAKKFLRNVNMLATLETTTGRADCRAKDICICQQKNHHRPRAMTDGYYICLSSSESARSKYYYHIRYYSSILDPPVLIPTARIKLQDGHGY